MSLIKGKWVETFFFFLLLLSFSFPRAFRRIDQCEPGDVVYLTVYVFQSDEASWMMTRKLIEAKKRGCDVQVIYDAAGSSISDLVEETSFLGKKSLTNGKTDPKIYQTLRDNGIPTIKYPIGKAKSQLNHRKMLLVGGGPNSRIPATGYIFINVGTEYFAIWDDFGWEVGGKKLLFIACFVVLCFRVQAALSLT